MISFYNSQLASRSLLQQFYYIFNTPVFYTVSIRSFNTILACTVKSKHFTKVFLWQSVHSYKGTY